MKSLAPLSAGLVIIIAITLALLPYAPLPYPGAHIGDFSTERAIQTIQQLSQSPRHLGAPGHFTARGYLTEELQAIGFHQEIQRVQVDGVEAPLENILARLEGRSASPDAVLLVAHYDSERNSPGACDNSSGVAIVMEIARAIATARTGHANDLIVLLSDGEELGMLGATGFYHQHPWSRDVRVALNFDSLCAGPLMMWQTSPNNGWLVRQFATSAPQPMATSWVDGVARILPLGTDLEPFLKGGITGASFTTPYLPVQNHTALDQMHVVSPAAIRHAGQQGSALTRRLVDSDLSQTTAQEVLFFNPWGWLLVSYPAHLAAPLGLFAALLFLAAVIRSLGRAMSAGNAAFWQGVGGGFLFAVANIIFSVLIQLILEAIFFFLAPLMALWIKMVISACLLVSLLGSGYFRLRRQYTQRAIQIGGQFLWLLLMVWTSLSGPLFSTQITLILLLSLLPYAFETSRAFPQQAYPIARLAAAALILLTGAPPVYMLYMISGILWVPALISAGLVALLTALLFPLVESIPTNDLPGQNLAL